MSALVPPSAKTPMQQVSVFVVSAGQPNWKRLKYSSWPSPVVLGTWQDVQGGLALIPLMLADRPVQS